MRKFVLRAASRPNQIEFSHSLDPLETFGNVSPIVTGSLLCFARGAASVGQSDMEPIARSGKVTGRPGPVPDPTGAVARDLRAPFDPLGLTTRPRSTSLATPISGAAPTTSSIAGRHIWDQRDMEGGMGVMTTVVIPWLVDRVAAGGNWTEGMNLMPGPRLRVGGWGLT